MKLEHFNTSDDLLALRKLRGDLLTLKKKCISTDFESIADKSEYHTALFNNYGEYVAPYINKDTIWGEAKGFSWWKFECDKKDKRLTTRVEKARVKMFTHDKFFKTADGRTYHNGEDAPSTLRRLLVVEDFDERHGDTYNDYGILKSPRALAIINKVKELVDKEQQIISAKNQTPKDLSK